MNIWAWLQPGKKIWKVVSDYESGTICVFNENGEIVFERIGLTRELIAIVEANFLDLVATNLSEDGPDIGIKKRSSIDLDNPMYV